MQCSGGAPISARVTKALGIVRSLRAAAEWDYPRQILEDLKVRFLAWFSDRQWRGDDSLLRHVDQLPPSWEQQAGDETASQRLLQQQENAREEVLKNILKCEAYGNSSDTQYLDQIRGLK